MQTWQKHDIHNMEKRYRTMFINSLSGFKSANLLATKSASGIENLCIVSSVFHIGADPAYIGMITRPQSVRRDSVTNIKQTGVYSLNHVNSEIVFPAHQTSARYPEEISEFDVTGLTPLYEPDFDAPLVRESQLRIGLKLVEIKLLEINQTELIIGEVVLVQTQQDAIEPDGSINIETINTLTVSGLDRYHTTHKLTRLSYAKPDIPLQELRYDEQP